VRPQAAPDVQLAVVAGGDRPGAVLGDPTRLRQILVNLAGNAVKFTRHGHVHLRVEAGAPQPDGSIPFRFIVEDTGIGIPADKHQDIFEAFSQAESSTTRRFGGTGLGLPIARQLAQLMNGSLHLVDSSSRGSVFELRLPLKPATLPRAPVAGQASLRVSGHVLVVDDNRVNLDIASAMLRYAGCTVDVAPGGQAAIDAVARQPYDLVFMDCQMPGMDGYEAAARLRSLGYSADRLPIVALTAGALAEDRARSLDAGMNDHLAKPLLEDPLLAVLARWLPHTHAPERDGDAAVPAVQEPADQPPLFNMETVRRTREIMDEIPGSWDAMVASFVTHGTQMMEKLTAAVADARTKDVRQHAHNMKGTAAMIGALRLSSWAADLEQAAQDDRTMLCVQLMPRLRAEFEAVSRALSSHDFL
jgi:CheY-like chemotaxis protein/HPt (histidine-containing phosphotransfer) domain-containing protein